MPSSSGQRSRLRHPQGSGSARRYLRVPSPSSTASRLYGLAPSSPLPHPCRRLQQNLCHFSLIYKFSRDSAASNPLLDSGAHAAPVIDRKHCHTVSRVYKRCRRATAPKFHILRKICVFERKNVKFYTFLHFLGICLTFFLFVFMPFCVRKISKKKFWLPKIIYF